MGGATHKNEKLKESSIVWLLSEQNMLRDSLPAVRKWLLKCCVCSEGGRRKRTEQKQGLAEARALAATRRTTGEEEKRNFTHTHSTRQALLWSIASKEPMTCIDAKKHFSVCVGASAHLSEPKKIIGDGGGAALDLYQRDLVFTCH